MILTSSCSVSGSTGPDGTPMRPCPNPSPTRVPGSNGVSLSNPDSPIPLVLSLGEPSVFTLDVATQYTVSVKEGQRIVLGAKQLADGPEMFNAILQIPGKCGPGSIIQETHISKYPRDLSIEHTMFTVPYTGEFELNVYVMTRQQITITLLNR